MIRRLLAVALILVALAGCSRDSGVERIWLEKDVTFDANGLTVHGTYRHLAGDGVGPAALLISESGQTDRNGDNNVAGPIGNMRQLAEFLSERGVATLRYDKIGTGATGLGPFASRPADGVAIPGRAGRHRRRPPLGVGRGGGHYSRDVAGR